MFSEGGSAQLLPQLLLRTKRQQEMDSSQVTSQYHHSAHHHHTHICDFYQHHVMFSIKSVLYQIKKCHWVIVKMVATASEHVSGDVARWNSADEDNFTQVSDRATKIMINLWQNIYDHDGNEVNQMKLLKMWSIILIYPDNLYVSNRFCVSKIYSPWFSQPLLWEEHIYFAYWYKYVNMGRHVSEIDLCSSLKSKSAWSLTPFCYSVWPGSQSKIPIT